MLQLVQSAQLASDVSPGAWSVTLREDGFRLNVGQVETFGLFGDTLRVLLAASPDDPRLAGQPVQATSYKSIPARQCAFVGTAKEFAQARQLIEPFHASFIEAAVRTPTGKIRTGSTFARYHSEALMAYAADVVGGPPYPKNQETLPYPFTVGAKYSRSDIFPIVGLDDPRGGPWYTGYTSHGPDWFLFCGIGTSGRTGHSYSNHFDGEHLVWFAKGPARLHQPAIQDLIDPAGRVYIFYREHDRDPFVFAGVGIAVDFEDTAPVRVTWALKQPDGKELPVGTPEEIEPSEYRDGAVRSVLVNVYERDPNARRKCIEHWGLLCQVCGFDFESAYGDLGVGFIHVHHLRPLGEVREAYVLDPVADLRPVCPNCHAMLHRERPALTIEHVKAKLRRQ